ncbi:MAG: hypothetical protein HY738_13550 [Bacteroidia bacterium]|nr:hypothetical protein [Bacteroidia bacterium]
MLKSKFQIFVENFVLSFLSILKVLILSNFFIGKLRSTKRNNVCVILGNGPGLEDSIGKNLNFFYDKDIFGVNFFWKSHYYTILQPENYVILSTNYWSVNQIPANRDGRLITFQQLAEKTTWRMNLYVPAIAKKEQQWKEEVNKNKNIAVHYFNFTAVEGFRFLNYFFFSHNLGIPRPHNVLIPCIKFAIEMKYNTIFLLGAEHSWLKEIVVSENNHVYFKNRHFYDDQAVKPQVMYRGTKSQARTLGEMLMKFVHTFNSYFILRDYAEKNYIKILNATKDSYIDAFERFPLPNQ